MKKTNVKKISLTMIGLIVLIIAVVGISYAIYRFTGTGVRENVINVGKISIAYDENTYINLSNKYAEEDAVGIARTTEGATLDFDVISNITGEETVNYAIGIIKYNFHYSYLFSLKFNFLLKLFCVNTEILLFTRYE